MDSKKSDLKSQKRKLEDDNDAHSDTTPHKRLVLFEDQVHLGWIVVP